MLELQVLRTFFPEFRDFPLSDERLEQGSLVFEKVADVSSGGPSKDSVHIFKSDTALGPPPIAVKGHGGVVHFIAQSPDKRTFASSSTDQTIHIWRFDDDNDSKKETHGQPLHQHQSSGSSSTGFAGRSNSFMGLPGRSSSFLGSPLCSGPGVFDTQTASSAAALVRVIFNAHSNDVVGMSYSSDGRFLSSVCLDGCLRIWDVIDGYARVVDEKAHGGNPLNCVCFAPFAASGGSSMLLATGSADRQVRIWKFDPAEKQIERIASLTGHAGCVAGVQFGVQFAEPRSGNVLVSYTVDREIRVWDVPSWGLIGVHCSQHSILDLLVVPGDSSRIVVCCADSCIRVWDVLLQNCLSEIKLDGCPLSMACSPDQTYVACAANDRAIHVFELQSGSCVRKFADSSTGVLRLSWSLDGKHLVSGSLDNDVLVWNTQDMHRRPTAVIREGGMPSLIDNQLIILRRGMIYSFKVSNASWAKALMQCFDFMIRQGQKISVAERDIQDRDQKIHKIETSLQASMFEQSVASKMLEERDSRIRESSGMLSRMSAELLKSKGRAFSDFASQTLLETTTVETEACASQTHSQRDCASETVLVSTCDDAVQCDDKMDDSCFGCIPVDHDEFGDALFFPSQSPSLEWAECVECAEPLTSRPRQDSCTQWDAATKNHMGCGTQDIAAGLDIDIGTEADEEPIVNALSFAERQAPGDSFLFREVVRTLVNRIQRLENDNAVLSALIRRQLADLRRASVLEDGSPRLAPHPEADRDADINKPGVSEAARNFAQEKRVRIVNMSRGLLGSLSELACDVEQLRQEIQALHCNCLSVCAPPVTTRAAIRKTTAERKRRLFRNFVRRVVPGALETASTLSTSSYSSRCHSRSSSLNARPTSSSTSSERWKI
eukprot:ANDGO_01297.mRNA.1 Vegetative incompatibility protein HET-E-1